MKGTIGKSAVVAALLVIGCAIPSFAGSKGGAVEGVVNVNTGSADELAMIPGIGPAKAREIVSFRQAHPLKAVSELTEVRGIGPKILEKIQSYLTVEGPTTIRLVKVEPASKQVAKPAAQKESAKP